MVRITRKQLRRIIRETVDVLNASTGEVMVFADEPDPESGRSPDAPELAAREIIKRLKLAPLEASSNPLQEPGTEEIWLGAEDYAAMDVEVDGKRHTRKNKKYRARMNIDNLLVRVDKWAEDAGDSYGRDNPDTDLEDISWDLSDGAQFQFRADEWAELTHHFDGNEEDLRIYIADIIAGTTL